MPNAQHQPKAFHSSMNLPCRENRPVVSTIKVSPKHRPSSFPRWKPNHRSVRIARTMLNWVIISNNWKTLANAKQRRAKVIAIRTKNGSIWHRRIWKSNAMNKVPGLPFIRRRNCKPPKQASNYPWHGNRRFSVSASNEIHGITRSNFFLRLSAMRLTWVRFVSFEMLRRGNNECSSRKCLAFSYGGVYEWWWSFLHSIFHSSHFRWITAVLVRLQTVETNNFFVFVFSMELALGQYHRSGIFTVWKHVSFLLSFSAPSMDTPCPSVGRFVPWSKASGGQQWWLTSWWRCFTIRSFPGLSTTWSCHSMVFGRSYRGKAVIIHGTRNVVWQPMPKNISIDLNWPIWPNDYATDRLPLEEVHCSPPLPPCQRTVRVWFTPRKNISSNVDRYDLEGEC